MKEFDIDVDLSEFFSIVSKGKKQHKEEFEHLISNSFEEMVLNQLKPKKKLSHNKKKQEIVEEKSEPLVEKSLGLLAEPSDKKVQSDPLTPLNQNFATHEDLQKHYQTFLARIQQQLSTLGGGGEYRFRFLDGLVGIKTNPDAYDNKFLQWNSQTQKAEFVNINAVPVDNIVQIVGITSYYQATNENDYIGVSADVPVTIDLPINPINGKKIIIKDEGNKITTNNITVRSGVGVSIENDTSLIMSINHQSFTVFYNGQNWYVI